MADGLFRREVFDNKKEEWLAGIHIQASRLGWWFFFIGIAALVGATLILTFGTVTRYEQAQGSLVPSHGLLSVAHTEPGHITRVLVEEGAQVTEGQPLIEISGETHSATLGETHAVIGEQIVLKQRHLTEEAADEASIADIKRKELVVRIKLLAEQKSQVAEKIQLARQRAANADLLYQQWVQLGSSGIVSKSQILQQHDMVLDYQAGVKDLEAQQLQLRREYEQATAELAQLPFDGQRKQNELHRQLSDLTESQVQNEAKRAAVIRAPAAGMITNVFVHPGDAIAPQQNLVNLLPVTSTLLAELWVAPRAVGFIRPGERVVIRYKAFPYQRFGQYEGRVVSVSRSAVAPNDITHLLGQPAEGSGPQYRIRVALDNQAVSIEGRSEPLIPGLTLDADILYEHERIASWLFTPISTRSTANVPDQGHSS